MADERQPVYSHPASGDVAGHCLRHEVPGRNELRPQRPGRPEHPDQQQPGVQSVGFRPVPLPAGELLRPHLHQLSGESAARLVVEDYYFLPPASQYSHVFLPFVSDSKVTLEKMSLKQVKTLRIQDVKKSADRTNKICLCKIS